MVPPVIQTKLIRDIEKETYALETKMKITSTLNALYIHFGSYNNKNGLQIYHLHSTQAQKDDSNSKKLKKKKHKDDNFLQVRTSN
jgi:hypothetical protein